MPTSLRFLLPVAAIALIGSLVLVAVTGDDSSPDDQADADQAQDEQTQDGAAEDGQTDDQADGGQEQAGDASEVREEVDINNLPAGVVREFPPAPAVPEGPWSDDTTDALGEIIVSLTNGLNPRAQIAGLADTGDARLVWPISDILRFIGPGEAADSLVGAVQQLAPELDVNPISPWGDTVDHLIAWDLPVPQDQYLVFKRGFYGEIEPQWADLFTDSNNVDWRYVGWGGVGIDDRPFGSDDLCRCIPALDDPAVTPASEGDWYPDDATVFGLVINDEARAYPKNIMEVHEMINDTLGGRDFGMPYCTLCGSAQAYFTDELPADLQEEFGRPVFRTSGLLIRSNKMMFELNSRSLIDTFQGDAASGPLHDAGVVFNQASVVTSTWGDWKAAHPDTTIIAEDGGIGRSYELDPLDGRDDDGPIFPIGDVDPRLPVQEPVLGVIGESGQPVAFHVEAAVQLLTDGEEIVIDGIELRRDAGGVRAIRTADGQDAGGHQSFWFAWSQFRPETAVWPLDFQ